MKRFSFACRSTGFFESMLAFSTVSSSRRSCLCKWHPKYFSRLSWSWFLITNNLPTIASEEKGLNEVTEFILWREDNQDSAKHYYFFCCFNLHVQFNITWCLQCLKMQLVNPFICLQELHCTGEYLKSVIVDSLCNTEISGVKKKSDCPIFAVCWAAVC